MEAGILNQVQEKAAADLLALRPPVLPGSNVVPDPEARLAWYRTVTKVLEAVEVQGYDACQAFCDLAGVPN